MFPDKFLDKCLCLLVIAWTVLKLLNSLAKRGLKSPPPVWDFVAVESRVIMMSLPLLKICYVLANFLIFSDTLLFKYFSLYVYFKGNLAPAAKFSNMASY